MPDAQRGGLLPETGVRLERGQVVVQLVVEGHGVQHEVAERTDRGQVGRAERPRRQGGVAAAPAVPDVRAVVSPHGQGHVSQRAVPGQPLPVGRRGQHDVEFALGDQGSHVVEEFAARAVPAGPGRAGRSGRSRRGEAERHVGVLGVRDHEVAGGVPARRDGAQLAVQAADGRIRHGHRSASPVSRR